FFSDVIPIGFFGDFTEGIAMILKSAIRLNIVLAVFKMIPIPPLDGSHIIRNLLPDTLADVYSQLSPLAGFVILLGLCLNGAVASLTIPIEQFVFNFVRF